MSIISKRALAPLTVGLAALGIAAAQTASAMVLYDVQFGNNAANAGTESVTTPYTGALVIGSSTDQFTLDSAPNGTITTNDTSGSAPISITSSAVKYNSTNNTSVASSAFEYDDPTTSTNRAFKSTPYANFFQSYLGTAATGSTTNYNIGQVSLTGLAPGGYTLYIYLANGSPNNTDNFSVDGGAYATLGPNKSSTTFIQGPANPSNYLIFNPVVDPTGTLNINYSNSKYEADFTGFQLLSNASPAPEPAQVAILLMMVLGLGGRMLRARSKCH